LVAWAETIASVDDFKKACDKRFGLGNTTFVKAVTTPF